MVGSLVVLQYRERLEASSNWVPPTAVLKGVDPRPLIPRPPVATAAFISSQPAAPLSIEATNTDMPCAVACCHRLLSI